MKNKVISGIIFCISFYLLSFNITTEQADESDVKAAFIINFTKYIEWESPNFDNAEKFKIGILADESLYKSMKSLSSKKIKDKTIELKYYSSLSQLEESHLIYVSEDLTLKDVKSCANSDKTKYALIIGDKKNALSNGASINFISVGSNLKFEINQLNLSNNKLKASSALLNLAVNVQK